MKPTRIRAWHKERKVMLDVVMIDFDDETFTAKENIKNWSGPEEPENRDYEWIPFDAVDFLYSTMLSDKNKVWIYEGDIIACGRNGATKNAAVEWDAPAFAINKPYTMLTPMRFPLVEYREVIGNIYENSELLEEK